MTIAIISRGTATPTAIVTLLSLGGASDETIS